MAELLICRAVRCSHCRLFFALRFFAFCSTTYVRRLSHLSLLAFVSFVFFTLRSHLFFLLRCHLFSFINSGAFSCYLSFVLPDEAFGRNVVNSTVCFSSVCSSLKYYTSIVFVLHKCRNFFSVAHFVAGIVVFSGQPPTFVSFVAFLYWVLSLLYFPHFAVTFFTYIAVTFSTS